MPQTIRTIRPDDLDRRALAGLLNGAVAPRAIAWVSTVSASGIFNVAPHSYSTVASIDPPVLLFVSIGLKDTLRNVSDTGDFVVNVVSADLVERMNITACNAPSDISEFELAGLTAVPSTVVRSPRVGEAPISLECEVDRIVPVGEQASLVLGRLRLAHVSDAVLDERDRIDPGALDAVARMGGEIYCTTKDRFELVRPSYADVVKEKS